MIIVVDGPEKAGKSTLVARLQSVLPNSTVRHWGPVSPDDRVYSKPLQEDAMSENWVIWDRCWASEHVYGKLLGRDRRLAEDPFLGEWLYGRTVQARGLRVMLLPSRPAVTSHLRDDSDLPVDPTQEYDMYENYARTYYWTTLINTYTETSLENNVRWIQAIISSTSYASVPDYAGPVKTKFVFVGEGRNVSGRATPIPGAWLPFTSRLTTILGRSLGYKAFTCGWTNIGGMPLKFFEDKIVIACGEKAAMWLQGNGVIRICIPHPAWLYRYNNFGMIAKRNLVNILLTAIGEYDE